MYQRRYLNYSQRVYPRYSAVAVVVFLPQIFVSFFSLEFSSIFLSSVRNLDGF